MGPEATPREPIRLPIEEKKPGSSHRNFPVALKSPPLPSSSRRSAPDIQPRRTSFLPMAFAPPSARIPPPYVSQKQPPPAPAHPPWHARPSRSPPPAAFRHRPG